MNKKLLSTTEVANLLSVTPDTVLKWVKAKKIRSYRTLGGHSRIPSEEVTLLLAEQNNVIPSPGFQPPQTTQYCWELLAEGGRVKNECMDCITYRSRARRCYELRDLPGDMGCLRMYCETSCEDCDYYQLMRGSKPNVLILSESKRILKNRDLLEKKSVLNVKFVENEYICSQVIEKFRPDFIIVDVSYGKKRTSTLCNYLFDDPRIPVTRIVIASKNREIEDYCDQEIFGWIKKPFTIEVLKEYIDGITLSESNK